MFTALLILQVVLGLTIIVLVLLQQGKGADMGAAFGAGSSGAVFGAGGGGSFFTRATAVLAAAFFINSVLLSSPLVREVHDGSTSVTENIEHRKPAIESDLPDVEIPAPADSIDLPPMDDLPEAPAVSTEPATDRP
ncbi:Protein translocase membrane subunit SecG [hydrothermal vent metagenome]|uniref:Protein translocase membrane subunit SecG n=1 Tax=hydrothermal vent metagenome TaxID=652676 RepID=A0A3B0YYA6_9ZZZZ